MEDWQINYITDNFLELCKQTKCSTKLVCLFMQKKMISIEEKTSIVSEVQFRVSKLYKRCIEKFSLQKNAYVNYGTIAGSSLMYEILRTRVDGYAELQKCLDEDRQTIPADILAEGYRICQQPVVSFANAIFLAVPVISSSF